MSEGRLVIELVRIATACGLRTPPELSLLGKTLLNLEQVAFALDPQLDVKTIVEDHIQHVMRERMRQSFSPANVAGEMLEVQSLLRESPRKVSDILSLLAENRLSVQLAGLDDSQLMENLQKIANRITAGVITAALILASAMLMRRGHAGRAPVRLPGAGAGAVPDRHGAGPDAGLERASPRPQGAAEGRTRAAIGPAR